MKIHIASLRTPYDPKSVHDLDFSEDAAHVLSAALTSLENDSTPTDELLQNFSSVRKLLRRRLSQTQRMQVFTVLGDIFWKMNECRAAGQCFEEALTLSEDVGDWGARAELAFRHGLAISVLFNYSLAADYFELSLDSLRAFLHPSALDLHALALEAEVHAALAMSKFALQEYDAATKSIQRCRDLAQVLPRYPLLRMRAERMESLVWRWRDDPQRALYHAHLASQQFRGTPTELSLKQSFGRLQLEIADILLDAAATEPRIPTVLPHHVEDAASCIRLADSCAHHTEDAIGMDLALLARMRQERAAGRDTERLPVIQGVLKRARLGGDVALHAQAYTSLAWELEARGEHEKALNCHRSAIKVVGKYDIPTMGKWSRDALVAASV